MLVAHRIRLAPNNLQRTYLTQAAGVARFAYNWALVEWRRQYDAYKAVPSLKPPNEAALRRQLNAIKHEHFPWMLKVSKCAPQMAIMQLGQAFENFFSGRARYPKFRRKGADDRFTITNADFRVENQRLRIPKLGWVAMREALRFTGHIVSVCISRTSDHWYASITVDCPKQLFNSAENQSAVGVDLGITTLATLSTGEAINGPKPLRRLLSIVRCLSRTLSRKVNGSANWTKAKLKLAKLYEKITNIRSNSLHQFTTSLTRRFHTIGIEDLSVKSMLRSRQMRRAILDMGWSELRHQLEYKAARRGSQVIVVDRWYPSSKTCSGCGHVLDVLPLNQRIWTCPRCSTSHNRDINAAINLMNMAVSSTASACGGEGSGFTHARKAKPAPAKQESSNKAHPG